MIGQKTAAMMQTSCATRAICAGADDERIETIGKFGYFLGIAFQIRDDILDIFGNEKEFGKKIGKDIID
ncbi:MAG: polyprenyl synthetase family protein [Candidatus Saccharimonadaceae bacterium]|nr:polyprenyl synthetase family protein [Candidatus Saccharimonadaceae bacterium]